MKTDWNFSGIGGFEEGGILLAHSNYEDGLKLQLNGFFLVGWRSFWRIPIMKTDWNITPSDYSKINVVFWRIPIMKTDWNNIENRRTEWLINFWRIPIMKTDWNICTECWECWVYCSFWRIPIMKTDWNMRTLNHKLPTKSTFGAFQLWRRIETCARTRVKFCWSDFWRIPIMKTDWNKCKMCSELTT